MSEENYRDFTGFIEFEPTRVSKLLRNVEANIVALFTGNQYGKGRTVADYLYDCITGRLPIERYNMRPNTKCRIIRLCSATLPQPNESKDGASEVKNTIYPVIKATFPRQLIKKDITARSPVMTLFDPQGGEDVQLEFTSYNQETQDVAGVQRFLIWCDEKPPFNFWEEQKPRTLATNGRMIITLTSIEANWTFEEIFERARKIVRTPAVVWAYKTYLNKDVPLVEILDSQEDIVVLQAATDDNPIWPNVIKEHKLNMTVDEYIRTKLNFDDPDTLLMRRYGILKQISGAIFKDFQWDIHVIRENKYFPTGIPHTWKIARLMDYHEGNPWATLWLALSPSNECFAWKEREYSPDKWTTLEAAKDIAIRTGDYKSSLDLGDPRMDIVQPSIGMSVMKDMNRIFSELKREGVGTGGYWQSWDTKSLKGRDSVKERLKNARQVGRPFNNKVIRDGKTAILPTLWILDECKQTAMSLKNWRMEEWRDRNAMVEKDPKDKPQQKWSHFCMCLEAVFKNPYFTPPHEEGWVRKEHYVAQAQYGQRRI